jgi:UDP-glucose 4-epimerase
MRVLVTGGAGFIGSHLTDRLVSLGHEVCIIDNLSTGKKKHINPQTRFYEMDIADETITTVFEKHTPQCIFHLAAQIDVRKSVQDPLYDARSNILGTINLLTRSIAHGARKFIFSSSGGVIYGDTVEPAGEDTPPNPISPYGVAKLAGEGYIKCLGAWKGLDYSILRYANVYGPRQDPKGEAGVVSIFMGQIASGERSVLYGEGRLERDYVFVDDVVEANTACIESGLNETYNIGTGIATSVEALYGNITNVICSQNEKAYQPKRAGELNRNVLCIEKAGCELGWKPLIDLQEGLQRTYEWFKSEKEQ